jgi:hypothetical protein
MLVAVLIAIFLIVLLILTIGKIDCDSGQDNSIKAEKQTQDSIMSTRDTSMEIVEQWVMPTLTSASMKMQRAQVQMHEVQMKENERLGRWPIEHSAGFWKTHDKNWGQITDEMWQQARERP